MAKEQGITFTVLSDPDLTVIDAYGLRHKGAAIDGSDIARPALFIVDASGNIKWRFLTDNWRVRARVEDILKELTLKELTR